VDDPVEAFVNKQYGRDALKAPPFIAALQPSHGGFRYLIVRASEQERWYQRTDLERLVCGIESEAPGTEVFGVRLYRKLEDGKYDFIRYPPLCSVVGSCDAAGHSGCHVATPHHAK
jgi:hypothetical protein